MDNNTQITSKRRLTSDDDDDDNRVNINYFYFIFSFLPFFAYIYLIFCPSLYPSICMFTKQE